MIKILAAETIRACDRAACDRFGIPGLLLMENAGLQTVECLIDVFGAIPESAVVVCGKGNNGGDGLVIARHLANAGCAVEVVLGTDADELDGDPATNLAIVRAMGIPLHEVPDEEAWEDAGLDLEEFDLVIDAILGTGLADPPRGMAAVLIEAVVDADVPVVSVDLPSGLAADSGEVLGAAVEADLTVAFAAAKPCHVLPPASVHCGELAVVDIAIPAILLDRAEAAFWLLERADWEAVRPWREPGDHKGDRGRVLVIAGTPGTAGAAVLTARGALRAGAGLVHVACPAAVWPLIGAQLTEALVHPFEAGLGLAARPALDERLAGADAVALGPGVGTAEETARLVRALAREVAAPMVIDADGLNALVGHLDELRAAPGPRVLTPHPGEAARLLGIEPAAVQEDRPEALRKLVEASGAVVLLKGQHTLIGAPDRTPVINPTGNPGMASGGTGDVLTGILATLLAQGIEPFEAAWAGAWVHGEAGDLAAFRRGQAGLIASDVVDALPEAMGDADGDGSGNGPAA